MSGSSWTILRSFRIAVHQRLRARRAAGDVDVDRHELVGGDERVVVEDAGRAAAGAHRDRPLRLEHLVVDAADDRRHLDRDAPGEDQQVGLARRGAERLEAEARDVDARGDDRHHLDRAAGEAEGRGEEGVASAPRRRPCRASSSSRFLRRSARARRPRGAPAASFPPGRLRAAAGGEFSPRTRSASGLTPRGPTGPGMLSRFTSTRVHPAARRRRTRRTAGR